jgi:hypothetical protein
MSFTNKNRHGTLHSGILAKQASFTTIHRNLPAKVQKIPDTPKRISGNVISFLW